MVGVTEAAPPRALSFELNQDMLDRLREEFDPAPVAQRLADALAGKGPEQASAAAQEMFEAYGRAWMGRTLQLGEEYPDRTYEVLKEAADRTGELTFPHVLQRFVEIAYLSTQRFLRLPVIQNHPRRLVYRVPQCRMFQMVQEKCGAEIASDLHCRHACLTAARTACEHLRTDAAVAMEATTPKQGYCQFALERR